MDQDRWKTVNHIFHAALEVSPSERHAFIHSASNGDPELQAEVEVLLKADQDAGSYLETPLLPGELFSSSAPPVSAGDVLCGRFRILRAVGEGGMGHVFEAYDSELAVHVALKIIRPEIASNPETLNRFRQEVRLARQITHPNVCRTFDIERESRVVDPASGTKKELVFLTMEFLQGETLDSRIKRAGLLPLDEALQIAGQIADALFAAHSFGIVHRDMKPANIMLVPVESAPDSSFRAVITDFGLARLDTVLPQGNHSPLSHSGRPIGTLAYMAPEQLEGTAVSAATDIYAFGLILFEMVTGTRAFPTDNFLSGIAKRLSGPPPSPSTIVPKLPASWCRAIEGCLRLNPADRFQSATDVIAALEGSRTNLPRVIKPTLLQRLTLVSWPSRTRFLAFSGILFAALALSGVAFRLYRSRVDSQVAPGASIYLTPVKNETGIRALDNITELLRAGLSQSAQVNLLDQSRVGDTLQLMTKSPDTPIDPPIAREIAMRSGAVRIIFATVRGTAGNYQLNVDIQQPDNTPARYRDHWTETFSWKSSDLNANSGTIPPELTTAVRNSTDWIRFKTGESRNDIARLDAAPEDVTTPNWDALADYEEAERLVAHGQRDEALIKLRSAVRKDPDFALALGRLGDIEVNLYRKEDGYRDYLKALDAGASRRLSLRERNRIKGLYAMDTGDFQTAADTFQEYSSLYEHDYLGWFYRARPLSMLGRSPEAIEVLKKAHEVDPLKSGALILLVSENLIVGDNAEAIKWSDSLRSMNDKDAAWFSDGILAFVNGDLSASTRLLHNPSDSANPMARSESIRYLADLQAEQGNYSEAANLLGRALANGRQSAYMLMDRAYAIGMAGDSVQCAQTVERALQLDSSPDMVLRASLTLGRVYSRLTGANANPIRASLALLPGRLSAGNFGVITTETRYRVLGEALLARGEAEAALREFRKADSLEAPRISREYLGRALEAMAAHRSDASKADQWRRAALDSYAFPAMHPAVIWQFPTEYPPGAYAESIEDWLRVANSIGLRDSTYKTLQDKLLLLRPHSAPSSILAGASDHRLKPLAGTSTSKQP
jgi:serine/threonine protein kinase/tetratricopeptide (TPR) repeat protein